MASPDATEAEAREAAIRLLARREHSAAELRRKLGQRDWAADTVARVVDGLAAQGLQSDRRFAESYARQRAERAYGPRRILAELGERGIERDLAADAVNILDVDFHELAARWVSRKYPQPAADYRERARRAQALARRGFEHEHLRGLFDAV